MSQLRGVYLTALSILLGAAGNVFAFKTPEAGIAAKLPQIPCTIAGHEITCNSIDYPGADSTQTWGINSRGQILGNYVSGGVMHGFRLTRHGFSSIDYPNADLTYVNGINVWGDVVGGYTAGGITHGFLLSHGTYSTIDFPGAMSTEVLGINDKGEMTGDYSSTNAATPCCAAGTVGFRLSGGNFSLVQFPGAVLTYGSGINRAGEIVGSYNDGRGRAFLLSNGNYTSLADPSTSTTFLNALWINDEGDIVGRYVDSSGRFGYLLSDGEYSKIQVLGGTFTGATAINSEGDIVGRYADAKGVFHGFLMKRHPQYEITDLGTLGGPFSDALGINDRGHVTGGSILSDGSLHGYLWTSEHGMRDLGTLPGGKNSEAGRLNDKDVIPVAADTSIPDPYKEDFCGFGTPVTCIATVWRDGVLMPLPTLKGGHSAFPINANVHGEIVGFSENAIKDPSCATASPGHVFDFEAVVWERNGRIHELPPLPGDTVGFAAGSNNGGQSVGASGTCATTPLVPLFVGPHAVLWERDGSPTPIGGLGGTLINSGASINDHEEVLGLSSLAGDTTIHAYLWTRENGTTDLNTLPGDGSSIPAVKHALNNNGQAVGASCPSGDPIHDVVNGLCRAFLWDGSEMLDLNALVRAGSNSGQLFLLLGFSINDSKEIAGWGVTSSGEVHAFLARPIRGRAGEAESATQVQRPNIVVSDSTRMVLQHALRSR